MGISLPSFLANKLSAGQSILSDDCTIVVDGDIPSPSPLVHSSSMISSFSHSSTSSSSANSTVTVRSVNNKRVMAAPEPPLPVKRMKQQPITQYKKSDKDQSAAARDAQIDCFLFEGLPFLLADSPYLRRWLDLHRLGDGEVMGRRQLATNLQKRVDVVIEQVVVQLKKCHGVTVGIDGWTNPNHNKVINVCPVGRGVAYYWSSVVLRAFADAETQCPPIAAQLTSISSCARVVAIVTDNEAVNGALYKRLKVIFPFLIHIPCAAHTIQLCVRKVMALPTVERIVDGLGRLLLAFKGSKELRVSMKAQQALLRRDRPALQLLTVCDTRWNSTLFAAERVLVLEQCIRPFIPDIISAVGENSFTFCDSSFWHPLRALVAFLQPYRLATNILQSDKATLSDVHDQFAQLIVAADDLVIPHPFASLREDVKSCIKKEWNGHVNISIVIMCSIFSFSPSYEHFTVAQVNEAGRWFQDWGTEYLSRYRLSDSKDKDTIIVLLQNQMSAFNQKTGVFADLDTDRARRTRVAEKEGNIDNPCDIWGLKLRSAPELSHCALALLELTASEAAVERSFSRQGLVHSKLRNRLSDHTVQLSMSFAFNSRALQQSVAVEEKGGRSCPMIMSQSISSGERNCSV